MNVKLRIDVNVKLRIDVSEKNSGTRRRNPTKRHDTQSEFRIILLNFVSAFLSVIPSREADWAGRR